MVKAFLNFDKMVSTSLIKIIHVVVLVILVVSGLFSVIIYIVKGELLLSFYALMAVVFFPFFWRILCEGCILLFSIHESLVEIKNQRA